MPQPHLSLTEPVHDRRGQRRKDDAFLDERWRDPSSRVLVVSGTRVRPVDGQVRWVGSDEAPEGTRVLLGERDGATWWAVLTPPELSAADKDAWVPLRGLLPHLSGDVDDAPLVVHALGLAEWLFVTRYCPRCGEPLTPRAAGHELRCPQDHVQFPRLDPAVIMLVTAGEPGADDERCLLGNSPHWPAGRYSTLAGFCEPGETLEDAVRREVAEETGIVVGEVTYFGNQPWPLPASLMLGFTGRAVTTDIEVDAHEIADARWFTRAQMREEADAGTLLLPGGISISHSLIESWYGGRLPGGW